MKEIIAIIRPRKMSATKEALDGLGFPCMTAVQVLGRGKQRGIAGELNVDIRPEELAKGKYKAVSYIPKRMLSVVVPDKAVAPVVNTIVEINRTGQVGDGRVFVCPIDDALRVRTDEHGESAIL
ncbi:Nitrogen regulatory protein P-II [Pseudodesulfovibrio hydrargyri]|uniref:Nitrogen regulatory protein P-II n=1 Tax=Pseudodesulfovibrio hydrargyri TaxID=2125990 RepID=A0A1J5NDQ6_9BACT|nr:P-II family nitrogen regulator [Pseudodesulfovibrio hydrargyri]OIQ51343.1 Nitrogen regulatory protein P-II [Pseudodesulfovibrio hydrargyri]